MKTIFSRIWFHFNVENHSIKISFLKIDLTTVKIQIYINISFKDIFVWQHVKTAVILFSFGWYAGLWSGGVCVYDCVFSIN